MSAAGPKHLQAEQEQRVDRATCDLRSGAQGSPLVHRHTGMDAQEQGSGTRRYTVEDLRIFNSYDAITKRPYLYVGADVLTEAHALEIMCENMPAEAQCTVQRLAGWTVVSSLLDWLQDPSGDPLQRIVSVPVNGYRREIAVAALAEGLTAAFDGVVTFRRGVPPPFEVHQCLATVEGRAVAFLCPA